MSLFTSGRLVVGLATVVVPASITACGSAPRLGAPLVPANSDVPSIRFAENDAGLCAIRVPGRLVCWNARGESAGGDRMRVVDDVTDYVEVAVGDRHICGLRRDGEVRCFNEQGGAPSPVAGMPPAVQIAADADATCARTASGEVWCFGDEVPWPAPDRPGRDAGPTRVPDLPVARHLSIGAGLACVAPADGGPVRCWGGYREAATAYTLPALRDMVEIRSTGMLVCGRTGAGRVTCASQPRPTQGFGMSNDWPRPAATLVYPHVDDARALSVYWATVCVRRRSGDLVCDGEGSSGPIRKESLEEQSGAEAFVLVDGDIACGIDEDGELVIQSNARGFCGEERMVADGAGTDLVEARRSGFTADLSPRFRLGASTRQDVADAETHFASGFEVPLLFGAPEGFHIGPVLDLATVSFDTFEPGAGLAVALPIGDFQLGAEALAAKAWRGGAPESVVGGGLRFGGAVPLDGTGCGGDCGLRYVATGTLEVMLRHGLGGDGGRGASELIFVFAFDPVALAVPFMLATADWSFR